jgi:hypothetical protein
MDIHGLLANTLLSFLEKYHKLSLMNECLQTYLEAAKQSAKACERPIRSRKDEISYLLTVGYIGIFVVILRLISRWVIIKQYEWDDWLILASLVRENSVAEAVSNHGTDR